MHRIQRSDGSQFVNAKIVGAGYVLKRKYLRAATRAFNEHLETGDKLFREAGTDKLRLNEAMKQYQHDAMGLLMDYLYLPRKEALVRLDFTKMSTMELAKNKPWSSKHTWEIVQTNKNACLLFYRPPNISFELHGHLDVHTKGAYYESVSAVHDAFHYVPADKRRADRPVYIFNVEEVYDNGPTPKAYGARIA